MTDDLQETLEIYLQDLLKEEIEALVEAAAEAHISGDVAAHLALKLQVDFKQVHKEALQYCKGYKTQLITRGGSTCTVPILDDAGNITGYKQKFVPWMKEYHENQRRQLATAVQDMIKEGKSVKNAAKDIDDIFNKYKGHAESTIQTESRKANTAGSLTRYKKNGVEKWEWSTAGSDVCPYCAGLQGEIFDINESGQQPRPPLHNRCRCRLLPVIDLEAEIAAMEDEFDTEDEGISEDKPFETHAENFEYVNKDREKFADILHDSKYDRRTDLSLDQKSALSMYQGDGYRDMNGVLRGTLNSSNLDDVTLRMIQKDIDNAVSAYGNELSKTTMDHTHFFGMGGEKAEEIIQSGQYIEPAFRSTSLDLNTAMNFAAKDRGADGYMNIFTFQSKTGESAISLGETEYEYLLPPGGKYKITGVAKIDTLNSKYTREGKDKSILFDKVRLIYLEKK